MRTSVDTSALVAGFGPPESVDTSPEIAGLTVRGRWTPPATWWPGWRPHPRSPAALADRGPGGLEIGVRRFAADRGRLLDAAERPPESPQRQHLLLFGVVQDVAHASDGTWVPRRRQRLGCSVWRPFSDVHQWPVLGVHRGAVGRPLRPSMFSKRYGAAGIYS
jgi:hypothetical protein